MVAYLKVGLQVRTYSDYLRAACEAKKEDSIELPQGPRAQTTDNPAPPKKACCTLAHLEEEDAGNVEDPESVNPSRIKGVTEEFMVHLAWAVKDAKQMRNTTTTVAAWNISSTIAHL